MRALRTQAAIFLVALVVPAAALANDFQDVYREYKRTGTIKPCRFSDHKLDNAQRQTPPDVEQYAPSFLDALQSARERGADCGRKPAAAPVPAPAPTTPSSAPPTASVPTARPPAATTRAPATAAPPPAPKVPAQPAVAGVPSPPVAQAQKDDKAPAVVWLIAALAALIALSAVFAGLAWWFGWSADGLTRPWSASWDEFGGRAADLGGEFREWLRTGH